HPSPHPFLRRNLADGSLRDLQPVDVVTLLAPGGDVLGDAFYNARSDMAFRRITRGDERLDAAFLLRAADRAARLREALPEGARDATALRLVHAEGDELSGLVVDRYGDVLSVELHSAGWTLLLEPLLDALHARFGTKHHRVSLSERVADFEGVRPLELVSPGCPASVTVREHGMRFRVDFDGGHKTGFFCDQRINRRLLAEQVEGADVLDLCTYTGGFAVSAKALGAAASVTAVDLDETALATAKTNANLNQARISFVHADAFDWCRQIGAGERRFDAIVLDPPKFI
ncbi:MAG: class I SAM-dependent rRNA methyltransferase, partial [Planctomycetes bacterium]|nr:class I SAM-dependent rRNA methyltransferase [Planctomycetota bacterium]